MSKTQIKEINFNKDFSVNNFAVKDVKDPVASQDAVNLRTLQAYLQQLPMKKPVKVVRDTNFAGYSNVTDKYTGVLSAPTFDGVVLSDQDRVLFIGTTDARGNGIFYYNAGTGEFLRTTDADNSGVGTEVFGGIIVFATQGNSYADKGFELQLPESNVVLGTDSQVWGIFNQQVLQNIRHTKLDKDLTPAAATVDGTSTGIAITETPANDDYVRIFVNGRAQTLGDAVKTKSFYFSADAGVTAKSIEAISAGDVLYVNPSILAFELETTDRISLDYLKA